MLTTLGCCALLSLAPTDPPDWGGFRGNNGLGVAPEAVLPDTLGAEESRLWRLEVPPGYSSPVVAGGLVFVTAGEGTTLSTIAVDRYTGEVRWRREMEFDGKRVGANSPASPTPATDGERVYALFHSTGLFAYDLEGELVWHRDFEPFNIPHGLATSPVLHGDTLLLQIDQDVEPYLLALDKRTGEERWRVERRGVAHSYATPAVWAPADGPAQVVVSGSFQIAGYSIETGEKLWWVDGAAWQTKGVPTIADGICFVNASFLAPSEMGSPKMPPTWEGLLADKDADGDGKIAKSEWEDDVLHQIWFIFDLDGDDLLGPEDYAYARRTENSPGGLFAIELGGEGDVTATNVLWKSEDRRGLPDAPSPLLHAGLLWLVKEGGVLTALDPATGEVAHRGRVAEPDRYFASPVGAAGKVLTTSLSGQVALVSAGREWKELSVMNLDEEIWSTPAIAGEQLFVRSQEALYCFQDMSGE